MTALSVLPIVTKQLNYQIPLPSKQEVNSFPLISNIQSNLEVNLAMENDYFELLVFIMFIAIF